MVCYGAGTQQGGRRRRGKGKKMTRKVRRGGGYGFTGALGGTSAGPQWGPDGQADAVDPRTGGVIQDPALPATGGRRRGKGKKSRKSRKGRKGRKTMRGGASWYSSSNSGGSFTGDGQAGLLSLKSYPVNTPGGGPAEGPDGVLHP